MMSRLRLPTTIGILVLTLGFACGEANDPISSPWRGVGDLSALVKANALTVTPEGKVLVVGCDDNYRATVVEYSGSELVTSFISPYRDSEFFSVCCGNNTIWAVGTIFENGAPKAYVIEKSPGRPWREISVPPELGLKYLGPILYHPKGVYWVLGSNGEEGRVYEVENTSWNLIAKQPVVQYSLFTVTAKGRVFNYVASVAEASLLISDDGGTNWVRELLPLVYGSYAVKSVTSGSIAIAPRGEGLYLAVPLIHSSNDFELWGVIERDDSPPGSGNYSLAFASPHGPWFWDIRAMAFRDAANGYALGTMTSVRIKDGQWLLELIPEQWSPIFSHITVGPQGYWAISETAAQTNRPYLYYAPF